AFISRVASNAKIDLTTEFLTIFKENDRLGYGNETQSQEHPTSRGLLFPALHWGNSTPSSTLSNCERRRRELRPLKHWTGTCYPSNILQDDSSYCSQKKKKCRSICENSCALKGSERMVSDCGLLCHRFEPSSTQRPAIVGQRCTLNLSRAETSSRWCGVVVRRGSASSGGSIAHVTLPWFKITWSVAKPSCS
ncbi:uncharacterized protein TNCV_2965781, partial [Trichonephila clavipes]